MADPDPLADLGERLVALEQRLAALLGPVTADDAHTRAVELTGLSKSFLALSVRFLDLARQASGGAEKALRAAEPGDAGTQS